MVVVVVVLLLIGSEFYYSVNNYILIDNVGGFVLPRSGRKYIQLQC